jgi:hypothetical protein
MNPSNGNPGKPGETIFAKYFNGLRETNVRLGGIDEAAVRLAMHLAITDALALRDPAPPACHVSNATDQRIAEWQQSQIGRLNEWLEINRTDLYFNGDFDTAQAILAALASLEERLTASQAIIADLRVALRKAEVITAEQPGYEEQQNRLMRWLIDNEPVASLTCDDKGVAGVIIDTLNKQRVTIEDLVCDLTRARNEVDVLRDERAKLKADIEVLILERDQAEYEAQANGAAVDPTPAPDWGPSHPAWQGLTAMEQETVSRLATGEIKWRTLSKALRRDLATRALQHLSAERAISSGAFDKTRPSWMPTANTLGATVAQSWSDLQAAASAA